MTTKVFITKESGKTVTAYIKSDDEAKIMTDINSYELFVRIGNVILKTSDISSIKFSKHEETYYEDDRDETEDGNLGYFHNKKVRLLKTLDREMDEVRTLVHYDDVFYETVEDGRKMFKEDQPLFGENNIDYYELYNEKEDVSSLIGRRILITKVYGEEVKIYATIKNVSSSLLTYQLGDLEVIDGRENFSELRNPLIATRSNSLFGLNKNFYYDVLEDE